MEIKRQLLPDPYFYRRHRYLPRIEQFTPCSYCCERYATGWDHVLPLICGGTNEQTNLVPCCKRCNSILGGKRFRTFYAKREYLREKLLGVPDPILTEEEMAEVLQSVVPDKELGEETSENQYVRKDFPCPCETYPYSNNDCVHCITYKNGVFRCKICKNYGTVDRIIDHIIIKHHVYNSRSMYFIVRRLYALYFGLLNT